MRKQFAVPAVAAALIAVLGAAPALASASTTAAGALSRDGFAGYSWGRHLYPTFRLSATVRVPRLICSDKTTKSVLAGIQMYDGTTSFFPAAELFLGCANGVANVYPAVSAGDPWPTGYPQDAAQSGDTIELNFSASKTSYTESVVDETRYFKVGGTPTRLNSRLYRWTGGIGDYPWQAPHSTPPLLPDFGRLHFSKVLFDGSPIGSAKGVVSNQWTGKIATSAIGKDHESFTTTFKHS